MKMIRRRPITTAFVLAGLLFFAWGVMVFTDPINRLALKLSLNFVGTMEWENGLWGLVNLPASAKPEDVIRARIGPNMPYQILEMKTIWIYGSSPRPLFAALVDSDRARQIYVFHYNAFGHWGIRSYDL